MSLSAIQEDVKGLVEGLNYAQKVDRALWLIEEAHKEYGNRLVVANSLGKDSVVVWHLAKRVSPDIRGFIVTTRFKPKETVQFMHEQVAGDVFKPGRHELEAARLELFAGASAGGDDAEAPFDCDVVFVSMRQFLEWKWHTREPIVMRDEAFGPVRTRAQGTCNFRIHDPALFVQGMRRCTRDFWPDDIDRALQDILVNSVATALEEAPLPISKLAANDADLADWLLQTVRPGFHAAGVEISKACPQSISLPPEIEQELRTRYRG